MKGDPKLALDGGFVYESREGGGGVVCEICTDLGWCKLGNGAVGCSR